MRTPRRIIATLVAVGMLSVGTVSCVDPTPGNPYQLSWFGGLMTILLFQVLHVPCGPEGPIGCVS
jgi:hypothetical protein